MRQVQSVLAYVVRDDKLLVWGTAEQPDAPARVPESYLQDGESMRTAVVRHVVESTGLGVGIVGYLGAAEYGMSLHGRDHVQQRHVFQLACGEDQVPDHWEHSGPGPDREGEPMVRALWWHPLDDPDLPGALSSGQGCLLARVRH